MLRDDTEKLKLRIGIEEFEPVITYEIIRADSKTSYVNKQITLADFGEYSGMSDKIIVTSDGEIYAPDNISDEEAFNFLDNIYAGGVQDKAIRHLFREEEAAFKDAFSKMLNDQNAREAYIKFRDYVNPSIETKIKEHGCTIGEKIESIEYKFLPRDISDQISFRKYLDPLFGYITLIEASDKLGKKTIFAETYTKDEGFISQEILTGKHIEDINAEIETITNEAHRDLFLQMPQEQQF